LISSSSLLNEKLIHRLRATIFYLNETIPASIELVEASPEHKAASHFIGVLRDSR
jgi:hypothetical protein